MEFRRAARGAAICAGDGLAFGLQDVGDDDMIAGLAEGDSRRFADANAAAG